MTMNPTPARLGKAIEVLANLATLVLAGVLIVVVARGGLGSSPSRPESAPPLDARPDLTSVGALQKPSLLLFLRSDCRFCTASAGFYRKLVEAKSPVQIVAIFGEPEDQARAYLKSLEVGIEDVRRADHRALGVLATPVALLVDARGVIVGRWIGALPPDRENEVLSRIRVAPSS